MELENDDQPVELDLNLDDALSTISLDPSSDNRADESNAQPPQPRRTRDPELAKRQREEQVKVNAAMQATLSERRKSLPGEFTLTKSGRVAIRSRPGSSAVFDSIAQRILSPAGAIETQTAIRLYVLAAHPSHNVPKNWAVKLPYWAVKRIQVRIQCSAAPFSSIRITSKTTLASLHSAARFAWQQHQTGTVNIKATVTISSDTITINGVPAAIATQKTKGRSYRYARISIDKLIERHTALAKSAPPPLDHASSPPPKRRQAAPQETA